MRKLVGYNLEAGALPAFFVLPGTRLDAAFDKNQRALFEILLGNFRLLAPEDNLVPLGSLVAFAVAVLVGFVRSDRKSATAWPPWPWV